jgi:hypothetical protein
MSDTPDDILARIRAKNSEKTKQKNALLCKRGRFSITRMILLQQPEVLLAVMSHMLIVRAESMFDSDKIEYIAYSNLFDTISESEPTPSYTIIIAETKDGPKVTAERHGLKSQERSVFL